MKSLLAFVSLTVNSLGFPFIEPPLRGNECPGGYAQLVGTDDIGIVFITGEHSFTYFTLRGDRPLIGLSADGIWIKGD